MNPTRRSHIVSRTVLAIVILGLGLTMCASPRAAERSFEIWAVRASGKALREDQPNWVRVSVDPFPSRSECLAALPEISIDRMLRSTGWRLTCRQTDR